MGLKYQKRGEIATILAVLSMAVMMLGVAIGSQLSQNKQTTSAKASGTEYYTYCNDNDRGDNPGQPGSIYAITNKSNYVSEKDTCGNGYITEWYCDGTDNPHSVSHVCNQCTQGSGGDYCETIGGVYKSPTPVPPSATPQPSATSAPQSPQSTVTPSPTEGAHSTPATPTPSPTIPIVVGPVASITPSPTVTRTPTGSPVPTATRVPSPTPTSTACIADGESSPNPNNSATRCCSGVWYVPTVGSGGYVCGYRPGYEPTATPVPAQQYTLRLSGQHSGTGKSYGCTLSWTKNGSAVSSSGAIKNGTGSFDCTGGATNSSAGVLINLSENYSLGVVMSLEYSKCSVSGCAVQSSMYAGAPSTLGGSVSCNWNFNADGTVPTCTSGSTITLPSPTPARAVTPTITLTPTPGVKSYVMQLGYQNTTGKTYYCSVYWKKGPNGVFDNGEAKSGSGMFSCEGQRATTTDAQVGIHFTESYSLGYQVTLTYGACNGNMSCSPTSSQSGGTVSSHDGSVSCTWNYETGSPTCRESSTSSHSGALSTSESQYYAMFDADNNKTLTVNDWLRFVQNMPPACSGRVAVCASQLLSHLGYQLQ